MGTSYSTTIDKMYVPFLNLSDCQWYTVPLLYLRFMVPLVGLAYLIRKNPFYRSYPIMLPLMCVAWVGFLIQTVKYSRKTNHMVHQILLDATGSELTFVYKNQRIRKMRSDQLEATFMVSNMMNPPQGDDYRPLVGDIFPQQFPFDFTELFNYRYFYMKYYLTQRSSFAIAKRPQYANYEVLCNALATRVIDYSQAEIYLLRNSEMKKEELERVLSSQHEFSFEAFVMRWMQVKALDKLET